MAESGPDWHPVIDSSMADRGLDLYPVVGDHMAERGRFVSSCW